MKLGLLLVDDDEIDVQIMRRALQKTAMAAGVTLHVAKDGVEALDLLKGANGLPSLPKPLVLLIDINMPRMNGIELIRQVRSDPNLKLMPVVVLTSSRNSRDVCEAYENCVAGYFVKPLDGGELTAMIETFLKYWKASHIDGDCK